jgi:4-amino-4-deoxy-L-arabinose transferase-like glycosyltransferase
VHALIILTAGLALFCQASTVTDQLGSLGGDNARYLLLADAIRSGHGYVDIDRPGHPRHTLYPPVFPLMLAPFRALDPDGYRLAHALVVVSSLASVLAVFFLFRPPFGTAWALLSAALTAFLPVFARSLLPILSELPFAALTLWALVCWDRHQRRGGEVGAPLIGACALAAAAFLTRTAGVALLAAVVLAAAWRWPLRRGGPSSFRKQGLALVVSLAVVIPVVGGWYLWTRQGGPSHAGYLEQLVARDPYDPSKGQMDLAAFAHRAGERLLLYGTFVPDVFLEGFGLGPIMKIIGRVLLAGLFALGLFHGLRRPRLWMLYLALYLAMVLVWPFEGERFLLPVVPLIIGVLIAGGVALQGLLAWFLPRSVATGLATAPIVVLLLGCLPGWVKFYRITSQSLEYHAPSAFATSLDFSGYHNVHVWVAKGLDPRRCARAWGDYIAVGRYVARHDPEAVVACRNPRITALTAGITTVGLPAPGPAREWLAELERKGVRYVVSLRGAFRPDAAQRALNTARERFPERLHTECGLPNVEMLKLARASGRVE